MTATAITRAQIPTVTVGTNILMVSGFSTLGDFGAAAIYMLVGAGGGPMAIQDLSGAWYQLVINGCANVGWFGAAGNGTKASGGSDDTAAIISAISALAAAGGGTLHFNADGIYRVKDTGYGAGIFNAYGNVSFDGHGCTILADAAIHYFLINSQQPVSTTITSDVTPGTNTAAVASTAGFFVGDTIYYYLYQDPNDANESSLFGFATILAIGSNQFTFDITWDRPSSIASATHNYTKSISRLFPFIQNIFLKNFTLDETTAAAGTSLASTYTDLCRNVIVENVVSKAGSGHVSYFTDNVNYRNFLISNCSRCTNFAQSTNGYVENLWAKNLFIPTGAGNEQYFGNLFYTEFYAEVSAKNIYLNNSASSLSTFVPLVSTHNCKLHVEDLHISGLGGFQLYRDLTSTESVTIKNLTLDVATALTTLPNFKGLFNYRIAGGAITHIDLDALITSTFTIATLPTILPAGSRTFVSNGVASPVLGVIPSTTGTQLDPVYFDGTNWRYG